MSTRGDKPNGWYTSFNEHGQAVQGETRQCYHCQYTWEYVPGSGARRGYCTACKGLVCGRKACFDEQRKLTRGTPYLCLPFDEKDKRFLENAYKSHPDVKIEGNKMTIPDGFTILESGMIVPSVSPGHTHALQ